MKSNKLIFLIILLIAVVFVDIFIRTRYCANTFLSFNSQEFNNILSPIVSLLGFVGVIVTILLTLKQNKHQQGSNYFNYYREQINKIASETPSKDNSLAYSTYELLDFPIYVSNKYDDLQKFPEYFSDLEKLKNGIAVKSEGKLYDSILGNIRLFSASLDILLKRYKSFINEIDNHEVLDDNQKQLLLKELFDSQIEKYYFGCYIVDFEPELKTIKENLYIAFAASNTSLKFFDNHFYKLKNIIDGREDLKKFTEP